MEQEARLLLPKIAKELGRENTTTRLHMVESTLALDKIEAEPAIHQRLSKIWEQLRPFQRSPPPTLPLRSWASHPMQVFVPLRVPACRTQASL